LSIASNVGSELFITNYGIQKFDQNSTSKTFSLNQTFEEFSKNCTNLEFANDLNFSLIYSPPERITAVKLYFETNLAVDYGYDTLRDKLKINLFVSPYRNCVIKLTIEQMIRLTWFKNSNQTYDDYYEYLIFLCELNSLKDYNKETIIPNSMRFSFKSEIKFRLRICKILVYRFEDKCGIPDIPIGAEILRSNDERTIEILGPSHGKRYRIIGGNTLKCTFDGNWDKEPPLFEPEIQCNLRNFNSSLYKKIKFLDLEFFNETKVAVINSKVLFQCNNGENSSKIQVSICNENGSWIGDDFNCKLNSKYLKLKNQLINCIFR
jgi:hypothetical protein